jgi:hypothetical protein
VVPTHSQALMAPFYRGYQPQVEWTLVLHRGDILDREMGPQHRVDRVVGFFTRRPNWEPPQTPTPLPAGECVPPFDSGGDTLA